MHINLVFGLLLMTIATNNILLKIPDHHSIVKSVHCNDSIPSIYSLSDEKIDTVLGSFKRKTVTVKLKTADSLVYDISKMKYDDSKNLCPKIRAMTEKLDKTFTKAEQMPAFPGGTEAWNDYVKKYCADNKQRLKKIQPGRVLVQFTVDLNGEIINVEALNGNASPLAKAAEDAVKNSPNWIPAKQNGRLVVCMQIQAVEINANP